MRAQEMQADVVVTIVGSLIATPVARLAAAPTGAKSWLPVQDFEVDDTLFVLDGLGIRLGRAFERVLLHMFDRVSSISSGVCRKLAEKGVDADRIV